MMDYKERIIEKMEKKLIEMMGKEAYSEFATSVAKEVFRSEIDGMAESGFKDYLINHFDQITQQSDGLPS